MAACSHAVPVQLKWAPLQMTLNSEETPQRSQQKWLEKQGLNHHTQLGHCSVASFLSITVIVIALLYIRATSTCSTIVGLTTAAFYIIISVQTAVCFMTDVCLLASVCLFTMFSHFDGYCNLNIVKWYLSSNTVNAFYLSWHFKQYKLRI